MTRIVRILAFSLLPASVVCRIRKARDEARIVWRRIRWKGSDRYCPVCSSSVRCFLPGLRIPRPDSMCPVCGAQERHRAVWMFLTKETELIKRNLRVLHVAPEGCYVRILETWRHLEYVTMDLRSPDVMVQADLTNLDFEDGQFDFVICNHVLEHIPDDQAAIQEVRRVLAPGGSALFTVPGCGNAPTEEGAPSMDDAERSRRFGHPGHVRLYGVDLRDRLEGCGFATDLTQYGSELPHAERVRLGIGNGYPIFYCRT